MTRDDEFLISGSEEIVPEELQKRGEFIDVYRGRVSEAERPARILAPSSELDNDDVVDAFTEAAIGWHNASTHPNIVSVYSRGETPKPWIAVEQRPEQTLDTVQPELSDADIKTVIWETGEALRNAALYNTTHLSLSPQSICVRRTASDDLTALVDEWGIKHAVQTASNQLGVNGYTAPELFTAPDAGEKRTDVYGLAAIAYYAVTGQPPVSGEDLQTLIREGDIQPPSQHNEGMSSTVDSVLLQGLATNPSDRYNTVHALNQAFEQAFRPEE